MSSPGTAIDEARALLARSGLTDVLRRGYQRPWDSVPPHAFRNSQTPS
jgi:hypothetical protein